MDSQAAAGLGAGLAIALLVFIFLWVFLFHCLCPHRDVLRPWRVYEKPAIEEAEELKVVRVERVSKKRKQEVGTIPKKTKPKSLRFKKTPQKHEIERASDRSPEELRKIERNIVSTISAQINRGSSLNENMSYENVQQRVTKLPIIDEKNRLSNNRGSNAYMEPVNTLKSQKSNHSTSTLQSQRSYMSVVNVQEGEDRASLVHNMVRSYGNISDPTKMSRDYDQGSIISNSSRVQAMVKGFSNLSRQNSTASSIDRNSLYSRPEKYVRGQKNSGDPSSLAEFMHRQPTRRHDSGSSHTPSVPPKDLY